MASFYFTVKAVPYQANEYCRSLRLVIARAEVLDWCENTSLRFAILGAFHHDVQQLNFKRMFSTVGRSQRLRAEE